MTFSFTLNPSLDVDLLRRIYASKQRLHVPDFIDLESARSLYTHLKSRDDWLLVFNAHDRIYELNAEAQNNLSNEKRELLDKAIFENAAAGFQYRYRSIRVSDDTAERARSKDILSNFAQFISSDQVLSVFKIITGRGDFNFGDAQATAYWPGDFLTSHNDNIEGKHRRAAYVMNLTPNWRAESGGLLMFHGVDGHIDEAYVPRFNALNIFSVPQVHSVSLITPSAAAPRYAVTGWLRSHIEL
jgi:SM-20-related protein